MTHSRIGILMAALTLATALVPPAEASTAPLRVNPDPNTPATGQLLSLVDNYVYMWSSVTRTLTITPAVAAFGAPESCSSGDVNAEGGCEQSDGCEWNDDAPIGKAWWTEGSGYTEADLKFGRCVGSRIYTPTGATGYRADYRGAFRAADIPLGTYRPVGTIVWLSSEDGGPLGQDGARNYIPLTEAPACTLQQAAQRTVGSCVYSAAGDDVEVPGNFHDIALVAGFRVQTQWQVFQNGAWADFGQPWNLDCPDCMPTVGAPVF